MLGEIQSLDFFLLCNSQADGRIDHLQDRQRPHDAQEPGNCDANELIHDLVGVSFQKSGRQNISLRIFENRIDCAHRENSSQ